MWKDKNGNVYTEEDLFNIALEECYSEESAYLYLNAGALFWRYWLRKWLPSHLRNYIKKQLPQALKEKYPKGNIKLTLPHIQKLQ